MLRYDSLNATTINDLVALLNSAVNNGYRPIGGHTLKTIRRDRDWKGDVADVYVYEVIVVREEK